MTPKEQLLLEIEQTPDVIIEMVLSWLQSLRQLFQNAEEQAVTCPGDLSMNSHPLGSKESGLPSFLETLAEIHAEVPWSEWEKLPEDMATNIDHYLYGAPKVEE